MSSPPMKTAILLCDKVIVEHNTNKKSLIGCFTNVSGPEFPFTLDAFTIFLTLIGGHGKNSCRVEVKHMTKDDIGGKAIAKLMGDVVFKNPNDTVELAFEFKKFQFMEPGQYAIHFLCDNNPVAERRFNVTKDQ